MSLANMGKFVLVFSITTATAVTGCGQSVQLPIERISPNVEWYRSGAIPTALMLRTVQPSGQPAARLGSCSVISPEQWVQLDGQLAQLHNEMTQPNRSLNSPMVSQWVVTPMETSKTELVFVDRTLFTNVSGSANFGAVNFRANARLSAQHVTLVLGDIRRTVSLTSDAQACMRANVCAQTNNHGGQFVSSVHYGSLLRVNLNDGQLQTGASVDAVPVAQVRFELRAENLDIQAVANGTFVPVLQDGRRYDFPAILEDLQQRRLLTVMNALRQMTTSLTIVAVEKETVTPEQCVQ